MIKKLEYNQLKKFCRNKDIVIDENKYTDHLIGQPSGAEALEFGLNVKSKGYNIYLAGLSASGKTTFAEKFARDIAVNENTPDDMCYVLDFEKPGTPKLLKLKAGMGKEFKADMEEFINQLSIEIPKVFSSIEYSDDKERILKGFQKKKDEAIKELTEEAKKYNFGIKTSGNGGIYFLPIIDGKTITEEEYEDLTEEQQEEINEGSDEVHEFANSAMKHIRDLDKAAKTEIENMDYNISLFTVGHYLSPVQDKYVDNEQVSKHLLQVKEDILNNIEMFTDDEDDNSDDPLSAMMPWNIKHNTDEVFEKYGVNLIVDNSNIKGAPVIVDYNPTYTNLVGEIEYENENGNLTTDFMKIKAGLLHRANGGYLIFHASDLVTSAFAWDTLKRALITGKVTIEPLKEYQFGGITVAGLQPESAEINIKVIIVGSMYYYELLKEYDEDFSKLFKICALFDYEMDFTEENINAMLGFVKNYCERHNLLPIEKKAMCEILEYSVRLAERQDKMTTRFGIICDILAEADAWARIDKAETITQQYIIKAVKKRVERVNIYAKKYNKMISDNEIMIDTEGEVVGQINGLCVMEMGDYTFGMPTRITASTYTGKAGIVNIEKEAEMSGSIHDKGMQVLIGYLGEKYAQKYPLTLSCRVCFEQSYNGVDGDSASSTETYAIISSLSGCPINQQLAVTGSMNQKGEIQPIGGVTFKIEGFFDVCRERGFTGKQGCIIPATNIKDLVLKDEIVEAVKEGKFHIYAIDSIDDGIELLMGKKAGKKLANGSYSKNSVHYLVENKLKGYYKMASNN